ncbi:MAG: TIGR01777 family protein [Verrucomicrobia bacterium]|nr:TIGR01777 family protein [Verrucomicrobiota bacterium]
MKILIAGSSGLIGSALAATLSQQGHQVTRLVREAVPCGSADLRWDPDSGAPDAKLEGFEAVVHLGGRNIASGRWTEAVKVSIRESRVRSTQLLSCALQEIRNPPRVFISASGISIYGNRGAEILTEDSSPGTGFLADVVREWEAATRPAAERGLRVANLRFGLVLSAHGGALAKMLLPFKLGLGGVVGSGEQYWSWITLEDAVRAIQHTLVTEALSGPLNLVSPNPVTNREFTRALGAALRRPTILPVPAFVARIALGEMADEALLASTRALPAMLAASGFKFLHSDLAEALRSLLQK